MDLDLNFFKREFIAGGVAGAIGIIIGFPFDLVKVKLQAYPGKYSSAWQCFRTSLSEDGVMGLYRGCIPPIATQGLINSLMFLGDSATIRLLEPQLQRGEVPGMMNSFIAGCAGGTLQCIVAVPAEVVKCTMQANTLHIGEKITTKVTVEAPVVEGRSSGKGNYPLQGRANEAFGTNTKSGGSEQLKKKVGSSNTRSFSSLFLGRTENVASFSRRRDIFRRSMHSSGNSSSGTRIGGSSAFAQTLYSINQIYATQGISGFYRGVGVTVIRDVPSIGLYFITYKYVRDALGRAEQLFWDRHRGVQVVAGPSEGTFISQPLQQEPSAVATLTAGAIAGAVSWISVYPFDVIKTNMQISRNIQTDASNALGSSRKPTVDRMTTYSVGISLYRQHGMRVFVRGLGTTILRSVPVNSTTFYFYEYFKDLLHAE